MVDRAARFLEIYETNEWGSRESRSGRGSDISAVKHVVPIVDAALIFTKARSLLDVGCGCCNWLRGVRMPLENYIGVDIVQPLIDTVATMRQFPPQWQNCELMQADVVADELPKADLVLARDVLPHFSYADIEAAIRNLASSGAEFLLTTSFECRDNVDITTGLWRPINLQAEPFSWPSPLKSWSENCPLDGGRYADKFLNLWCISDLPQDG